MIAPSWLSELVSSLMRLRAQPCWIVREAGVVGRRGRAEVRPMTGGTAEDVETLRTMLGSRGTPSSCGVTGREARD